jgi:hypothetical protein
MTARRIAELKSYPYSTATVDPVAKATRSAAAERKARTNRTCNVRARSTDQRRRKHNDNGFADHLNGQGSSGLCRSPWCSSRSRRRP